MDPSFLGENFCLLFKENIKVDWSFLDFEDVSHSNSVYPPNLNPFVVSINVIVIPRLSHFSWKSLISEPSRVFLNNNIGIKGLLLSHDCTSFCSN